MSASRSIDRTFLLDESLTTLQKNLLLTVMVFYGVGRSIGRWSGGANEGSMEENREHSEFILKKD